MRELLAKAWQRPLIVGLSLWLGFFGGSWATMRWLSMSIQNRIETRAELGRDIEDARQTLAQRIAEGRNPGRKSSNYTQDCTICVSCLLAGPCWIVPRKRESRA